MNDIQVVRDRLAMTQAEFAAMAGVRQSTVSRWERRRGTSIPFETVMQIVRASSGRVTLADFGVEDSTP